MHKIIKEYNVNAYADKMWALHHDMKSFLQQRFADQTREFDHNERFVFYLQDHDYFISDEFPGFTLYNLQLILKDLDISNFFCAVISNMPNFDRYTRMVRDILRPDDVAIRAVTIRPGILNMQKLLKETTIDFSKISSPFVVLSRLRRPHRIFFMSKLFNEGLQNDGLVSYHNIDSSRDIIPSTTVNLVPSQKLESCLFFLTTVPFTMLNQEMPILTLINQKILADFEQHVHRYCNFDHDNQAINNKTISTGFQNDPIQNGLIYVALETTVRYPTAFQSEISFKSIVQKRPFLIFGVPGSLRMLQDQGFKTFSQWWSEDYDLESDIEKRADMIIAILKNFSQMKPAQLQEICMQMQPVLEHNFQNFTETLVAKELGLKQLILDQTNIE